MSMGDNASTSTRVDVCGTGGSGLVIGWRRASLTLETWFAGDVQYNIPRRKCPLNFATMPGTCYQSQAS